MRLHELRRREDIDGILHRTLSRGWSAELSRPVTVRPADAGSPHGQPWRVQALLSAYFTADVRREVRHFLRDSFRWTPIRRRLPAQWALGTAVASRPGLRVASRPGFLVDPVVPHASYLLVMPGNRRVRIFDFRTMTTRVLLKDGFDPRTMLTEIASRTLTPGSRAASQPPPFPPILAHDPGGAWLTEPIISGHSLPRLPPWQPRARYASEALSLLSGWLERSQEEVDASTWLETLCQRIEDRAHQVEARYGFAPPELPLWLARLRDTARAADTLQIARTHGDMQPGNILVNPADDRVLLIDWEHSARRLSTYDFLVMGLKSRAVDGLADRFSAFVDGELTIDGLGPDARHRTWRLRTLAAFILEDLAFYLDESVDVPGTRPSHSLVLYVQQLGRFGAELDGLLGSAP